MRTAGALTLAACLVVGDFASAEALSDRDSGPLSGLFGFPDSREGGKLTAIGEQGWEIALATSSHSVSDTRSGEALLFDGETSRLGLTYRRGFTDRLELGFEVPWVMHESGNLDSFIDRWHKVFGLPDGIRDQRPDDRLLFRYVDRGAMTVLDRNSSGVGDLRLLAGWRLGKNGTALRFGIKLPTGDSARLLGSGGTDLSLGVAGDRERVGSVEGLSGFWRVNATWLGPHDLDTRRANNVVGQVAVGGGYAFNRRTTLSMQALLRSPLYDSAVSPLGDLAASLTVGVRFRLFDDYALAFAVGEDLHPESVPDVTFVLSLQRE